MRIAIMGTGGIGGFFTTTLAAANHEVVCIARGDHLAMIQRRGLTFIRGDGRVITCNIRATDSSSAVGPVDLILFCPKLYDAMPAARECLPLLQENTAVIPFQNGVEFMDLLKPIFGAHLVAGSVLVSCHKEHPGVVRQIGTHAAVKCGPTSPQIDRAVQFFMDSCHAFGIDTERASNVSLMLWTKFVRLVSISALTTMTRQPIGVIRSDPVMHPILVAAIDEAVAVAKAIGVELCSDLTGTILEGIKQLPGSFKSSQLYDLENGRPLEVEWLSGAVHRIGQIAGVRTPIHSTAYAALKPFLNGHSVRTESTVL